LLYYGFIYLFYNKNKQMKKLIPIFCFVFLFVLVIPVFAMTIEVDNVEIQGDNTIHLYNFGDKHFVATSLLSFKVVSGDFSEVVASCNGGAGTYCSADVIPEEVLTGDLSLAVGSGSSIGAVDDYYLVGEYVDNGLGATNVLATLMGGIVNSSTSLALNVFQVYWPYVLIIGIIGALVALFGRFLINKFK
jgi:uncharacterized membrane protein YfcA